MIVKTNLMSLELLSCLTNFSIKFSPPPTVPQSTEERALSLAVINVTLETVFNTLAALDFTKAVGIDGIPNYILKHCAISINEPTLYLFKQCIAQSYLPAEWRIHKIVPVYKSGDKTSITNYRPISLLCCISKVLESIVYNDVYDHISSTICDNQFGFLCNRSIVQQLLL